MRNVEFAELRRKSHTIVKVEFLSKKSIFTKLVLSNYNLKRFTGLFLLGLFCLYFRKIYPREIKRKLRNQENFFYFGGKIQILSISSKYRIICSWTFFANLLWIFHPREKKWKLRNQGNFFYFGGKIQILWIFSISSKYRIICSWSFFPTHPGFFPGFFSAIFPGIFLNILLYFPWEKLIQNKFLTTLITTFPYNNYSMKVWNCKLKSKYCSQE